MGNEINGFSKTRDKQFAGWCYFCNKELLTSEAVEINDVDEGAVSCHTCNNNRPDELNEEEELNFE